MLSLDNQEVFKFSNYSKEIFPKAETLLKYLADFKEKFHLNVFYKTNINNVKCNEKSNKNKSLKKHCDFFHLIDDNLNQYQCKLVFSLKSISRGFFDYF